MDTIWAGCFYGDNLGLTESIIYFGIKVFILIWIIFVPIAITSRLEKIIQLLKDKNKS
jgi:hypothetical protein